MDILVKNVSYNAGGVEILKDISFELQNGSFTAIVGPNGAGKSTLIKIMLGLLRPTCGNVLYDGVSVDIVNSKRQWLGYVAQNFAFDRSLPMTLDEFFTLSCDISDNVKYNRSLEALNIAHLKNRMMGGFSGGEIQRVMIAYNLFCGRRAIFLDEPTSAIDIEGESLIYSNLREINAKYETNIIIISHDIDTVLKNVDTVICLNKTLHCIGGACEILEGGKIQEFFDGHRGLYRHGGCKHH